jgi:hypothetical protein
MKGGRQSGSGRTTQQETEAERQKRKRKEVDEQKLRSERERQTRALTRAADDDGLGDAVGKRARAPGTSTTPDDSPVRQRRRGSGRGDPIKESLNTSEDEVETSNAVEVGGSSKLKARIGLQVK